MRPKMRTSFRWCFSSITGPARSYHALEPFARRNLNLMKIESRPVHGSPWQYRFYLDLQASRRDPEVAAALAELESLVVNLRILGFVRFRIAIGQHKILAICEDSKMIFNMVGEATDEQINHIVERIKECGYEAHLIRGKERTVIGVVGNSDARAARNLSRSAPRRASRRSCGFRIPSSSPRGACGPKARCSILARASRSAATEVVVAAGPCAVESRGADRRASPRAWRKAGAKLLRGGAFKPRSSPYSFQGLGEEGLKMMRDGGGPATACWSSAK